MPTTNPAGLDSIYIESQSPSPGWIRGRLKNNPKITGGEIDILDKTTKRSNDIWHSDKALMSINNRQIFEIPRNFMEAQIWFLANEAARCYDRVTIRPLLPQDEL